MNDDQDNKKILDKQSRCWSTGIIALAEKIATATGAACVLLLVTPRGRDKSVAPELIAENALRVSNLGWPEGFDVEILNRSK